MERIWTPWRRNYVTGQVVEEGCIFCLALERAEADESLVVHVAEHSFVVVNLFPYSSGHVMVAPRRHVARLAEMTDGELAEMMMLARRLEAALGQAYRPHGLNLGMNLGRTAGAGVEEHLHLHLVPRWNGDANFMTVVGGTRLIPDEPLETCRRLRKAFGQEG